VKSIEIHRMIWYNQVNHFNQAPTPSHPAFEKTLSIFHVGTVRSGRFSFCGQWRAVAGSDRIQFAKGLFFVCGFHRVLMNQSHFL